MNILCKLLETFKTTGLHRFIHAPMFENFFCLMYANVKFCCVSVLFFFFSFSCMSHAKRSHFPTTDHTNKMMLLRKQPKNRDGERRKREPQATTTTTTKSENGCVWKIHGHTRNNFIMKK